MQVALNQVIEVALHQSLYFKSRRATNLRASGLFIAVTLVVTQYLERTE